MMSDVTRRQEEGLEALVSAPQDIDNWNGPYLKKTTKLVDPVGARPYNLPLPGSHGEFDLFSYGAHADQAKNDEKPPIANW